MFLYSNLFSLAKHFSLLIKLPLPFENMIVAILIYIHLPSAVILYGLFTLKGFGIPFLHLRCCFCLSPYFLCVSLDYQFHFIFFIQSVPAYWDHLLIYHSILNNWKYILSIPSPMLHNLFLFVLMFLEFWLLL